MVLFFILSSWSIMTETPQKKMYEKNGERENEIIYIIYFKSVLRTNYKYVSLENNF